MEKLYGRDYEEMLASLALQDLRTTVSTMKADNQYADTRLRLSLEGRNPDDGVTDIAYQKGYFFLRSIEEKFGRDKFDAFLKNYFSANAFKSMDTNRFIENITTFYKTNYNVALDQSLLDKWIFTEGLPEDCPQPTGEKFKKVDSILDGWMHEKKVNPTVAKEWSTHEWLHFLKNLPDSISLDQMKALDKFGNFTASGNSEITTEWLVKVIRHQYSDAYARLEEFLVNTGRRKFLIPLYTELLKTPEGRIRAIEIYKKARPNYHFVATNTFDKVVK